MDKDFFVKFFRFTATFAMLYILLALSYYAEGYPLLLMMGFSFIIQSLWEIERKIDGH